MAPGVLIVVLLLLALAVLAGGRHLRRLRHEVQNAWAEIEAQLGSRRALVQRLIERGSCSALGEIEALDTVRKACRQAVEARGLPARAEAENQLSEALRCFFAAAGACRDREVNPCAHAALAELIAAEERIAAARRAYNHRVMAWNVRIAGFPWSLISRPASLHPVEYFVMDEPAVERKEPC